MPKLNRLTELLAIFTLVLLGHPDTASAQLFFSPSPAQLSISGPGGTAGPLSVNVSAPSPLTSLTINSINTTTGGNWLCAVVSSANTLNIYIGTTAGSCLTTTSTQLAANQSYTGTINVRDANFQTGTLTVNLTVGNGSGTGSGVAASPPSVSFIAPSGGQVGSQNVTVTVNGSATNITSFNFVPTSGVAFLNVSFSGATAILSVNNTNLSNGTYMGVLTLSTIFGSVNVQVTLTIGTGSNNGVAASPSSVSFSATPGGQVAPSAAALADLPGLEAPPEGRIDGPVRDQTRSRS